MGERLWYYSENEQQEGPIAESKLRQMVLSGIVHSNALAWTDGMTDWLPVTQVFPDLFQQQSAPPPVPRQQQQQQPYPPQQQHNPQAQAQYQQQQYTGGQPPVPAPRMYSADQNTDQQLTENKAPWRRLFARSCDMILFQTIATSPFLIFPALNAPFTNLTGPSFHIAFYVFQFFNVICWIPMEAACFQMFGTTPFKALFNVHVRTATGEKLDFGTSFSRNIELFFKAGFFAGLIPLTVWPANLSGPILMGMGILSFVLLVLQDIAYVKHGINDWDKNRNLFTATPKHGAGRNILMIIVCIVVTAAQSALSNLSPSGKLQQVPPSSTTPPASN